MEDQFNGNPDVQFTAYGSDDNHDKCEKLKVQHFIETTLISILEELRKDDGRPSVAISRRSTAQPTYSLNEETGALESSNNPTLLRGYSWPANTIQEAWRFGVIIRVLAAISDAIRGGFVSSKRDIYYQHPVFFGSQRVVDQCVDDIACSIGVNRTALHVAAAAKGLTAGGYTIVLRHGIVVDVGAHIEGLLIPRLTEVREVNLAEIRWILIVEKEAVFHRLVTSNYHKISAVGKGILVTAKGYPDLCTRAFVRLLFETGVSATSRVPPGSINIPKMYILVDSDPDGMAIMSTYKYGSMAQVHENAKLNVRSMGWLGLSTSETLSEAGRLGGGSSLMPLTLRDRRKAAAMLAKNPAFFQDGPEPGWRAELQRMLMMNSKAEIEILYDRPGGIEEWLDVKLKGDI